MRRLAIIGGGAWGTALAMVARRAGSLPKLWARDPGIVATINQSHQNPLFLPGVTLDPASPSINHGDKDIKVTVKAAADAALGDFTIKMTGHPEKGSDATNDLKLTIAKK